MNIKEIMHEAYTSRMSMTEKEKIDQDKKLREEDTKAVVFYSSIGLLYLFTSIYIYHISNINSWTEKLNDKQMIGGLLSIFLFSISLFFLTVGSMGLTVIQKDLYAKDISNKYLEF